jgi:hypothetical protein
MQLRSVGGHANERSGIVLVIQVVELIVITAERVFVGERSSGAELVRSDEARIVHRT